MRILLESIAIGVLLIKMHFTWSDHQTTCTYKSSVSAFRDFVFGNFFLVNYIIC